MLGPDPTFWRNRRVLVTGHTGFKGSWLTLWLAGMGARVSGMALPAHTQPNLFELCAQGKAATVYGDVTDYPLVLGTLAEHAPEIIIHMAAQALVRPSYVDPLGTYATNVMGTANLLQAVRSVPSVRAVLVVTSDKVYENDGAGKPFTEGDRLGGHDPYSNSKACAELVTSAFRHSFLHTDCRVATARAGNVIGGGDWSPFRIVRDVVEAFETGSPVALRYPDAVRPWQHVLEPLGGYLMLAQAMITAPATAPETLNFAPDPASFRTVADLVGALSARWGNRPGWAADGGVHPHEAPMLTLSAHKAEATMGWRPLLSFEETVEWTADWYSAFREGKDMAAVTERQIKAYEQRFSR